MRKAKLLRSLAGAAACSRADLAVVRGRRSSRSPGSPAARSRNAFAEAGERGGAC